MKKNQILLIVLLLLVITNIGLLLYDGQKSSGESNRDLFSVADTSLINSITLNGQKDSSIFKRTASGWLLNSTYKVDENLKDILIRTLNSTKVKRAISKLDQKKTFLKTKEKGVEVIVKDKEKNTLSHFYAHGNPLHTESYFADQKTEKTYVVEIPGYTNYISGLFTLIPSQWRNRKLFSTSWSSLRKIELIYKNEQNASFSIVPGDNFPTLEGITHYDTTTLMNYISLFDYFQSNEIIPNGLFPRYDSLSLTEPDVLMTIEDLDKSSSNTVKIFNALPSEEIQLIVDNKNNLAVIEAKRLKKLLVRKDNFLLAKKL